MKSLTPSTNIDILRHQTDALSMYPHKPLIFNFTGNSASTVELEPLPNRFRNNDYVIWIDNVIYESLYTGTNEVLDLTTTGLNGLVDGITFTAANARNFLVWALANDNNNGFSGFACTHKPYSSYTGPASIPFSASPVAITGLTNAFQFTSGARVVVRNTVGTAPQYQWNWGTIQSIDSTSQITVVMDTNSNYGVALTAATGGEIQQWDKFRPYVVTSSSHTYYSDSYRLIGEMYTDSSGNIGQTYRVDEPWRQIAHSQQVDDNTASPSPGTISAGRTVPLWSDACMIFWTVSSSVASRTYYVGNTTNSGVVQLQTVVSNAEHRAVGSMLFDVFAQLIWQAVSSNNYYRGYVSGYNITGGMRE